MYTLLKPLSVRQELLTRRVQIFTPLEFQRIFNLTAPKTKYFLETYTKRGLFWRLKKGLYALRTDPPPEEEIANRLYRPSYISFEYALAAYGLIPEMPYSITSATTKPTRTFVAADRSFAYSTIKGQAYAGYTSIERGGRTLLFATPEKALVDYLYFVSLGKRPQNDRLRTINLNWDMALQYAARYERAGLDQLVQSVRAAAESWERSPALPAADRAELPGGGATRGRRE